MPVLKYELRLKILYITNRTVTLLLDKYKALMQYNVLYLKKTFLFSFLQMLILFQTVHKNMNKEKTLIVSNGFININNKLLRSIHHLVYVNWTPN